MSEPLEIRDATAADLSAILEIYNDAVLTTTAVWDDAPRTPEAHQQWFDAKRAQGHPVLVALRGSQLAGFAVDLVRMERQL